MRRRGFTLIEVLVTLVVVTLFSAAVYSTFIGSVVGSRYVEQKTLCWRLGQGILRLLERDLTACAGTDAEGELAPFRGSLSFTESARLDLVSAVDSRQTAEGGRAADLVELAWLVEPDPGEEEGLNLYRVEEAAGLEEESSRKLLARGVKKFALEYFNGEAWVNTWDLPDPPLAVRVDLVLNQKLQETVTGQAREVEFPFRSVVVIPAGE